LNKERTTTTSIALSPSQAAEWSLRGSLSTVFAKTRSSGYTNALAAAKRANHYSEGPADFKTLHIAGFGRSQQQLALALFVITHLRRSSALQVFGGGKLIQDKWRIAEVLECVVTASSCADTRAHCVVVVDEDRLGIGAMPPTSVTINFATQPEMPDRFGLWRVGAREFPCRYLFEHGFRFQPSHPSSEAAQIQAAAVRAGCDWCPHLNRRSTAQTAARE
jgi:hypothetical protein